MKRSYFLIIVFAFFLAGRKGYSAPVRCFSEIVEPLAKIKNIDVSYVQLYKVFLNPGEKEELGRRCFERSARYIQHGSMWRYEATSRFKNGEKAGYIFSFKNDVYKKFDCSNVSILITKKQENKIFPRLFNPLFTMFSFLYEVEYYQPDGLEKINAIESLSPLLCDLNELTDAGKCESFFQEHHIRQTVNADSLVASFFTYLPLREGDRKLSSYQLKFKTTKEPFPFEMEKRDSAGNLAIQLKVLSFQKFQDVSVPKEMKISKYLDGKLVSESEIHMDSIKESISDEKIDIDPSCAKKINDEVNGISVEPDEFK